MNISGELSNITQGDGPKTKNQKYPATILVHGILVGFEGPIAISSRIGYSVVNTETELVDFCKNAGFTSVICIFSDNSVMLFDRVQLSFTPIRFYDINDFSPAKH